MVAATSEAAILSRILDIERSLASAELARDVIAWDFPLEDKQRMTELLEKAKAGQLTKSEKIAAENYERVGHLISMLKSKARVALKNPAHSR